MKIYFPIAKVDADKHEVWGYASTEARDDQGEVVKREALTAALGDYMKFANIREMHQLSAVGVAKEAGIDDKGLYVGAKIIDDQAWLKVIEGVYKGYSIGGRVTRRDPTDYKTITGLVLNEISLVDRPANPEAVFDYWKAAGGSAMSETRFNTPLQIWACAEPEHRHVTKADALKCLENRDLAKATDGGAGLILAAKKTMAQAAGAVVPAPVTPDAGSNGEVEYAGPGSQRDGEQDCPSKIKDAQGDQAVLDLALLTIDKCFEIQGLSERKKFCLESARDTLKAAGGETSANPTFALANSSEAGSTRSGPYTAKPVIDLIVTALGKHNTAHHALIDIAHDCIGALTAGGCCSRITAGARHPTTTMSRLFNAHAHLVSAGAGCDAVSETPGSFKEVGPNAKREPEKAAGVNGIVKALADERAENARLMTTLADILPRLDQLRKRVEEIAAMPMPPATIAKGTVTISKLQDNGGGDAAVTPDEVAAAFVRMSREEQTLTLIKASYARPIHPIGLGIAPRGE